MSSLSEDDKQILNKLLDKAGNDPRLTPRILREKAEQKLHLETGIDHFDIPTSNGLITTKN
jgi:hypothetical protein